MLLSEVIDPFIHPAACSPEKVEEQYFDPSGGFRCSSSSSALSKRYIPNDITHNVMLISNSSHETCVCVPGGECQHMAVAGVVSVVPALCSPPSLLCPAHRSSASLQRSSTLNKHSRNTHTNTFIWIQIFFALLWSDSNVKAWLDVSWGQGQGLTLVTQLLTLV